MRRERSKPGMPRPALLSLGVLATGAGFIWWASVNIGAASSEFADAHISLTSHPSPPVREPVESAVESDTPSDPPVPDEVLYPDYPAEGELIGTLSIPAVGQSFPIIEGTGDDELKRGVGHFRQSVLPGIEDNCVLSGHRDTVFTRLGELEMGDQLITETAAGRFTYEIVNIRIVDKDDKTVIVPADHAALTLSTCYPFNYVGSAPDRYILTADLVTD
ncbi:MAG: class D sortase [Coriobacteriia bacterium]|nr:class D sortase [Coriobacteriia bacterium]